MSDTIKMRAIASNGVTMVKAIITHPMDNGAARDKATGKRIPMHFIQEVTVEHGGKMVVSASWSRAVSRNPSLAFRFQGGNPGDAIKLFWKDNKGESDTLETKIG